MFHFHFVDLFLKPFLKFPDRFSRLFLKERETPIVADHLSWEEKLYEILKKYITIFVTFKNVFSFARLIGLNFFARHINIKIVNFTSS